ncbi:helix-turn-helix transcriptional regulator [Stappia sp. MMSF_3263]|uniref:ArsR/SmtB family transcription factor n=1 Tax=Stappia sp. MMSF_3263 TaxID=3046693 RepID=UPI00273F6CF4|nr:metalloregulator ArsR/SmtB family transcription factor [Stappia sp. MMSF_3263]
MDTPRAARGHERPAPAAFSPVVPPAVEIERLAQVFKALSHPVRVEIVSALSACAGACCGDIVRNLPLAQSTVSQHLAVLRASGLVEMRGEGRCCHYRLAADARALVETAIGQVFAARGCGGQTPNTLQVPSGACRKDTE